MEKVLDMSHFGFLIIKLISGMFQLDSLYIKIVSADWTELLCSFTCS